MNLQTVADNLRATIAGKEYMLQELIGMKANDIAKSIANDATIEFMKVNIAELKSILQDVEQCAKQASDDSWITNPDRMGGGGWTQDELDPNRGWK